MSQDSNRPVISANGYSGKTIFRFDQPDKLAQWLAGANINDVRCIP